MSRSALDVAGFVFGAGPYVYEKGAGSRLKLLDGDVDVGSVKQFI